MNELDLLVAITADKVWSRKQGELISKRIAKHFKNIPKTQYWISINYFEPEKGYNIFFNEKRLRTFQRSIPLARYPNLSFSQILSILHEVRKSYNLTFEYRNFTTEEKKTLYKELG